MVRIRLEERAHWNKRPFTDAAIASICALLIAFVIRFLLHPYIDDGIPTLTFVLATFYIAWKYGYKWGLVEEIAGFATATYFFVKPFNSFEMPCEADLYRMGYFFSITLLVIFIFEKTNRARYESELLAERANNQYLSLVKKDAELRQQRFVD